MLRKLEIQQIEKLPLEHRAAEVLRDLILSGAFPPGYRLVETRLAEQLGSSRGTVRAALSDLVHEGLVEQVAYTKWVVPPISFADARELFTLRSVLEGLGARLAAENRDDEGRERLRQAFRALADAGARNSRGRVTELDFTLHKLIIELSGHRHLQRQYTLIEQQIRRYIACSNALIPVVDNIVGEHAPLVGAILDGRAGAAEREARRHNMEDSKILLAQLRRQVAAGARLRLVGNLPGDGNAQERRGR